MRTRRPGHDTPAEGGSYWPWETGVEMPPPTFHVEEDEDDSVPGRNWMRSALIIIVALLVVFVMLYAFNRGRGGEERSEEHTSELQSLMRISYAVFCLKK